MIRTHSNAVKGLLVGLRVFVTRADPDAVLPYVVLHPDQGNASTTSYSGVSNWRPWRYQTTCVGSTAEQAQAAAERVEAGLLDVVPSVAGRVCSPIRKETSLPVDRDEDVQPPVFVARDTWVFSSVPA